MTNFERAYRYDIILILFLGAAGFLAYGAWHAAGVHESAISSAQFGINSALVCLALAVEWRNLADRKAKSEVRDRGLLSATVTLLALVGLPVIENTYSIARFQFPLLYCLSSVAFLSGVVLRFTAARQLERMFSHAVIIVDNHLLIMNGVYRYVRHPAYLGTLFMVIASIGLWQSYLQIGVAVVIVGLTIARIESEEAMLVDNFGSSYLDYKHRSWSLLPFVY